MTTADFFCQAGLIKYCSKAQALSLFFACFKISAVPINVNYRYVAGELRYLYDNADSIAVIVEPQFRDRLNSVLDDLPGVRLVLEIGPEYEASLAAASTARRSGHDRRRRA